MRIATRLCIGLSVLIARSIAQDSTEGATTSSTPTPTGLTGPCASIKAIQIAQSSQSTPTEPIKFNAGMAWDCMNSIPINTTDASELVDWAKDYYVFMSTQGWLQNPPASWQWPAFDFLGGLDNISTIINSNGFTSQLQLDLALINMTRNTRDFHNKLLTGTLTMFIFTTNFSVVSLSPDGSSLPQIFVYEDIVKSGSSPGGLGQDFTPSAIKSLGGQDPVQFLRNFTINNELTGYVEEHAEWNAQMSNYATLIGQRQAPAFNGTIFYNGDSIGVEFQNGSNYISDVWAFAKFNFSLSNDVQDIYNHFVLNGTTTIPPSSTATSFPEVSATDGFEDIPTATAAFSAREAEGTQLSFPDPHSPKYLDETEVLAEALQSFGGPYPSDPVVVQGDLGNTGFVTGYLFEESKLAVLSLPSFETKNSANVTDAVVEYATAVGNFIDASIEKGMQKLVIDLQANGGGTIFLGYEIFKRFFPGITPYGGWTFRATPQMNAISTQYTADTSDSSIRSQAGLSLSSPFNVYEDLSDNGTMYSTWSQAEGPIVDRGDNFTSTIQFNCSNDDVMSRLGFGQYTGLYGYGNRPATSTTPPWDPKNIILLTDGTCGSTCSIFSEFMKTEAGVKRVVMGGLPSTGPMQAVSGTRGSQTFELNDILAFTNTIRSNDSGSSVQDLPKSTSIPRINIHNTGSLNLQNQVRRGSDIPIQFIYEAADCRLWYTAAMMTNLTVLWTAAANAIWNDSSICVQGSTNQATAAPNITSLDAPNGAGTTTSGSGPSGTGTAPSATSSTSAAVAGAVAQGAFVAFIAALASALGAI